jgi:hypothetical protein
MSSFEDRASSRANWRVLRKPLQDEAPEAGPSDATAAWYAVLELTREAYAAAGIHSTRLPRAQWPSRLFRPGEPRADTHGL